MKKVIIAGICIVLAGLLIFGGRYLYRTVKYKKMVSEIVIQDPILSDIEDGSYKGSYDVLLVAVDVTVVVQDQKIKDIILDRHKNERGQPAEVITQQVLTQQSLNVDTVSGATNSSKVILKAIENALTAGKS